MRLMSSSPVAEPMGLALGPLILKPLYSMGLWLAVTMMPPTVSKWLTAK